MKIKILFILVLLTYLIVDKNILKDEKKIHIKETKLENDEKFDVILYRNLGIRKAATALLWIRQGLEIGTPLKNINDVKEKKRKIEKIYKNSLIISDLDPYFIQNYYTTASVLAFIKVYKAHKESILILKKGLKNNPDKILLKKYIGAVIASSNNDIDRLVELINDILSKKFDDDMIIFLSKTYEIKFNKTKNLFFLQKSILLWEKAYKNGTDKTKKYAYGKLEEYKNYNLVK